MLKIVILPTGSIVIGELKSESITEIEIGNPREVQLVQVSPGQTKFAILKMFGSPSSVILRVQNLICSYDCEEESIESCYAESCGLLTRPKPKEIIDITRNRH
jgi:hypothetical protein